METSTIPSLKGERMLVSLGFSTKPVTSPVRSTWTTPKSETWSGVMGLFRADGVDVLEDGVGGALVPGLGDALHGRKDLDELAEFRGDDGSPAFADVAIQREAFVLGEDVDVAQVRVDAVGQRDVDDAVLPGEGNGRFGAVARERKQPLACPASQQNA
jgi:hypothetical protein